MSGEDDNIPMAYCHELCELGGQPKTKLAFNLGVSLIVIGVVFLVIGIACLVAHFSYSSCVNPTSNQVLPLLELLRGSGVSGWIFLVLGILALLFGGLIYGNIIPVVTGPSILPTDSTPTDTATTPTDTETSDPRARSLLMSSQQ